MKWYTYVQNVASNIRNAHGILHKFKYVFPHIILFLYNNIVIPTKEYVKRNVHSQLLEFMSICTKKLNTLYQSI